MVQASQPDMDSSTPRTPLPWTPATIIHLAFAGDVEFAVRAVNNHAKLLKALEGLKCWDCEYPLTQADYAGCHSCTQARTAIEEAQS